MLSQSMKTGIRVKVLLAILTLITIIIVSIGVYTMISQSNSLRRNILENTESDARTFGFWAARAIVLDDDFIVVDSLKLLKKNPGYVYGRAINLRDKTVIYGLFGDQYQEKQEKYEDYLKLEDEFWELAETLEKDQTNIVEFSVSDESEKYYAISYPVFRPFAGDDPPRDGIVQVIISDAIIRDTIRRNVQGLIIASVLFWIVGGLGTYLLSSFIVKPLASLLIGAKKVGEGDLDYKVPVTSEDELGMLAKQFNSMTDGLKVAQQAKEEQLVFDEQIRQAKEIQEGMNPLHLFDNDFFQVKGFTRAAKGVGGDYFDFQELPDGRLALLISDVSGKSISASLVMVLIKTVVATYLNLFDYIRSDIICDTINRVMATQSHIDKFATMIFLIYDPKTGSVEFTNGGQGPLFVYRAVGKAVTMSKLPGLPLGIDEDNEYHVSKIHLHKGDMVVLYTDGITEAYNTVKDEYGLQGLRQNILDYSDNAADVIVDRIVKDIDEFATGMEQHDDMTLVVLKIK
ncbi:MAG: SpoIIE family protein phosphatase [Leptospirales bacterium]